MTWLALAKLRAGRPSPDTRLNREDIRSAVLRLLGCIQHVFENAERLQDKYGLLPKTPNISEETELEQPLTQSQLNSGLHI